MIVGAHALVAFGVCSCHITSRSSPGAQPPGRARRGASIMHVAGCVTNACAAA